MTITSERGAPTLSNREVGLGEEGRGRIRVLHAADSYCSKGTASRLGLKAGDDCPKCGGELEPVKHRFDSSGGAPDCDWLLCLDCNYETDQE